MTTRRIRKELRTFFEEKELTVKETQLISFALKSCTINLLGEIKLPQRSDKLLDTSFTWVIKVFTVSLLKELFAAILRIFWIFEAIL